MVAAFAELGVRLASACPTALYTVMSFVFCRFSISSPPATLLTIGVFDLCRMGEWETFAFVPLKVVPLTLN